MNGKNKTQRLGEDFLREIEEIIKEIEDKQKIKISVRQVTNLMIRHNDFQIIKKDIITFNFNEVKEKWGF